MSALLYSPAEDDSVVHMGVVVFDSYRHLPLNENRIELLGGVARGPVWSMPHFVSWVVVWVIMIGLEATIVNHPASPQNRPRDPYFPYICYFV